MQVGNVFANNFNCIPDYAICKNKVNVSKPECKFALHNENTKKILVGGLCVLSAAAIATIAIKKHKTKELVPVMKEQYQKIIEKYPEDAAYYKELAAKVNLGAKEEYKLAPIVGPSRLKSLLGEFSSQDFKVGDSYRVNLHNHTTHSDGAMTVGTLLDKACELADSAAQKFKDGKPPFTVAITDHDTLEGAKEAVEIIAQNPEKYKNLNVVLGGEFSLINTNPKNVRTPLNYEMVGYSLNPFDEKLNKYLEKLHSSRHKEMSNFIETANSKFPQFNFLKEEADYCSANIKKAITNGYMYDLENYLTLKSSLIKAGLSNAESQQFIKNYGADYLHSVAFKSNKEQILNDFLKNHGIEKGVKFDSEMLEKFASLRDGYVKNIEKLTQTGIARTGKGFFDEATEEASKGFYGLAHPALISLSTGSDYAQELIDYCSPRNIDWKKHLFKQFLEEEIQASNGKLIASEVNYQVYPNLYSGFGDYIDYVNETIKKSPAKILSTGGLDCHGLNLFTEK